MDSNGTCIGFKKCDRNPGSQWVQVEEISLVWLTKARPGTSDSNIEPSKEQYWIHSNLTLFSHNLPVKPLSNLKNLNNRRRSQLLQLIFNYINY